MKSSLLFRVGLVGAGYVSEFHIRALRRLPNTRLIGITDVDLDRARASGLTVYPSLTALVEAGVDVVHVLTPPGSHAAVTLEALRLGCHVLVEKPLATSVEDCDRIADAAKEAGKVVCVNHSLLGDPLVRRALELARSGAIGEVVAADYLRSSNYPPYRGGPLPPPYREGGYPFRDLGVHALYLLQEFLGEIQDVQADFRSAPMKDRDPNLHFDEWRALVRCERGTGNIQLSWNVKPLQHQLLLHGTRGTIRVDLFALFLTRRRHTPLPKAVERMVNALTESVSAAGQLLVNALRFLIGALQPYQGLHQLVADFYAALADGRPPPTGVDAARPVVRWTEHAARDADAAKEKLLAAYQPTDRPAVVVTGANGQLGRALLKRLLAEEEFVRVFVRRPPPPDIAAHPQVEVVLGELGDPVAVDRALSRATAVFHLGAAMGGPWEAHEAATITGTRHVIESCLKYRVPKVIYISSLSVIDWAGHPPDQPVTENSPLEPAPTKRGFYTQAKLEAERLVRQAAATRQLPVLIIRPGKIWSESGSLIDAAVALRFGRRYLLIGDGEIRLPLIHVDDVVEAIVKATQSPYADGRIYQVVGEEPLTRSELLSLHIGGREPGARVIHLSLGVACALARVVEFGFTLLKRNPPLTPYRLKSAYAPLTFDCQKARNELGWQPQVKSATALRKLLLASS